MRPTRGGVGPESVTCVAGQIEAAARFCVAAGRAEPDEQTVASMVERIRDMVINAIANGWRSISSGGVHATLDWQGPDVHVEIWVDPLPINAKVIDFPFKRRLNKMLRDDARAAPPPPKPKPRRELRLVVDNTRRKTS